VLKELVLTVFLGALGAGCTFTKFPRAIGGLSFLQRVEMPEVEVETNGTVRLKGYRNDGGAKAAAEIARGAARGAVEGMKP
jgi:hypothetical protein